MTVAKPIPNADKPLPNAAKTRLVFYPAKPDVERGVPRCSFEGCPEYRKTVDECRLSGRSVEDAHALCEPAVIAMADVLAALGIKPERP